VGSLSFALGGALAGGGAGIADAAKENLHAISQERLLQLKEEYESGRQDKLIQANKDLETQKETYETGRQERGYQVSATAAAATRDFEKWKVKMNVDAKRYASDSAYAAKVDAMYLRGAMSEKAAGTKKSGSYWKSVNVNVGQPMKPDPAHTGQMIPDIAAQPIQKPGMTNSRTGRIYAPQGDKYVPWDNEKMGPTPVRGASKAPPTPDEIADLLKDPNGIIPDGPNAGQYKSDVFETAHGYLPAPYFNAVQRAEAAGGAGSSSSSSSSITFPSGRQFKGPIPAANVGGDFEQPGAQGESPTEQDADTTPAGQ